MDNFNSLCLDRLLILGFRCVDFSGLLSPSSFLKESENFRLDSLSMVKVCPSIYRKAFDTFWRNRVPIVPALCRNTQLQSLKYCTEISRNLVGGNSLTFSGNWCYKNINISRTKTHIVKLQKALESLFNTATVQ